MDDDDYWRNNEIEGLRTELEGVFDPPADPEEKARRDEARARLAELEARESAVQTRYTRFKDNSSAPPQQADMFGDPKEQVEVMYSIAGYFLGTYTGEDENPIKRKSPHYASIAEAEDAYERMKVEPREWIIQKCNNAFKNDYEAWPGYDQPMTRTEMLAVLEEVEADNPHLEFRGHRVGKVLSMQPEQSEGPS